MTTTTMTMMMTMLKKPLVKGHPKLSEVVAMVTGVDEVGIVHLVMIFGHFLACGMYVIIITITTSQT